MSTGLPAELPSPPNVDPGARLERGFSLLEILVAFTILAMSLAVIYQIVSRGPRAARLTEEYTKAVILAESRLVSFDQETPPSSPTTHGLAYQTFRWVTTLHPYEHVTDASQTTGFMLYAITVHVAWDSLGKTHAVELQTVKLLPVP